MPDPANATPAPVKNGGVVWKAGSIGAGDAIPDSGLSHHYDATQESGTNPNWTDQSGAADLSNNGPSLVSDGINGNQSFEFDGVDDNFQSDDVSVTQPNTFFWVGEVFDMSDEPDYCIYDNNGSGGRQMFEASRDVSGGDHPSFYAGDWVDSNDAMTTNPTLFTLVWDGPDSLLRRDAVDDVSGDPGSEDMGSIQVGQRGTGDRSYSGYMGEMLIYDRRLSASEIDDVESHLSHKWGITI